MRRLSLSLVTAVVIVVNTWSVAAAQEQTQQTGGLCTVAGNITGDSSTTSQPLKVGVPLADQDTSKPLNGATLTFKGESTTQQARTDKHGDYRIELAPGSYVVDVMASGFVSEHQNVTVQGTPNDGICLELGFGLQTAAAAAATAHLNAQIDRNNALLSRPYSAKPMPVPATLPVDVQAFNESPASQTPACGAMARTVSLLATLNGKASLGDDIIEWSMEANAAKVCASDTRASAAERLPQFILLRACARLRETFDFVNATYRSETSWACGWPAPVPALRTVPGIMPPGYDQ